MAKRSVRRKRTLPRDPMVRSRTRRRVSRNKRSTNRSRNYRRGRPSRKRRTVSRKSRLVSKRMRGGMEAAPPIAAMVAPPIAAPIAAMVAPPIAAREASPIAAREASPIADLHYVYVDLANLFASSNPVMCPPPHAQFVHCASEFLNDKIWRFVESVIHQYLETLGARYTYDEKVLRMNPSQAQEFIRIVFVTPADNGEKSSPFSLFNPRSNGPPKIYPTLTPEFNEKWSQYGEAISFIWPGPPLHQSDPLQRNPKLLHPDASYNAHTRKSLDDVLIVFLMKEIMEVLMYDAWIISEDRMSETAYTFKDFFPSGGSITYLEMRESFGDTLLTPPKLYSITGPTDFITGSYKTAELGRLCDILYTEGQVVRAIKTDGGSTTLTTDSGREGTKIQRMKFRRFPTSREFRRFPTSRELTLEPIAQMTDMGHIQAKMKELDVSKGLDVGDVEIDAFVGSIVASPDMSIQIPKQVSKISNTMKQILLTANINMGQKLHSGAVDVKQQIGKSFNTRISEIYKLMSSLPPVVDGWEEEEVVTENTNKLHNLFILAHCEQSSPVFGKLPSPD